MSAIKREVVLGSSRLLLGDCREILPILGQFDAVVTDPPYGIGAAGGMGSGGTDATGRFKRKPRVYAGSWDSERPDRAVFDLMLSKASEQIVWGGNYFADMLPQSGRWLVWNKLNAMPSYSDAELAWTSLVGSAVKMKALCSGGVAANRDGARVHPTQKPVALMDWCLAHLASAQTILDPFMGSGTTGVACVKAGKPFTGIEISETFFEVACERIRSAQRQPDMFVVSPAKLPSLQADLLGGEL